MRVTEVVIVVGRATCEYCGREVPADVDQSDLPYPEHVACSHECSIFRAHQRVDAEALNPFEALDAHQLHKLWMHLSEQYAAAHVKRIAITGTDEESQSEWMHRAGQMQAYSDLRSEVGAVLTAKERAS